MRLLTMIMCANDNDYLYSRHWNVERTNKLPAKKVLWYEPSSECGKPMNADISWSASNTPEYCDKLGKFGRGVYGIREISKVRTPSFLPVIFTLIPPHSATALAFAQRSQVHVTSSALGVWQRRLATQQGAQAFAVQYANAQLQFRILFKWRVQLRAHLKHFRQAKYADKVFVMRRAFRMWVQRAEEHGREKRLKEWNKGRAGKIFVGMSESMFLAWFRIEILSSRRLEREGIEGAPPSTCRTASSEER